MTTAAVFDDLVKRHTGWMTRVALRIVGDPVEAEDVVQDAWISAWRAMDGFRGDSGHATWLYRVVTNAALGHVRRRRPTVPLEAEHEPTSLGPEHDLLRDETVQTVLKAIATLDPSQRVPLVMRELDGMGYPEIAALLGIGVPALRARLHRARVALLAKLKEPRCEPCLRCVA